MKEFFLVSAGILLIISCSGQTNFVWEKVDSVEKVKAQIYSDTKIFIAKTWKSSKSVIQDDDKDAGIILVRGASIAEASYLMNTYVFVYNYNVTFKMKDNRYKITLDNVHCESASTIGNKFSPSKIEPFDGDNCPETGTFNAPGLSRKKAIPMMASLKKDLQAIVDSYEAYIKKSNPSKDDW